MSTRRHTASTITDDALDALYENATDGWRRGDRWKQRAIEAEAERESVYRERAHLVAYLAALHPSHIGHTDPDAPDWSVVIVEAPGGQLSWHIAERDTDLFEHVCTTDRLCRGWDGHTTEEKYERLRALTTVTDPLPIGCHQCGDAGACNGGPCALRAALTETEESATP